MRAVAKTFVQLQEKRHTADYDIAKELNITAPTFFNTVEYMALLINHGYITDKVLRAYFDDVLAVWLERLDQYTRAVPNAKNQSFKEFRQLCKDRGCTPV